MYYYQRRQIIKHCKNASPYGVISIPLVKEATDLNFNFYSRLLNQLIIVRMIIFCNTLVIAVPVVSILSNLPRYLWSHKSVNYDRPGECSPEKDCLWWHRLTFRQPGRKSSSESSELWIVSRCYRPLVVILIGRRSRDFAIGRLSVKPWCYWLWRLLNVIGAFRSVFC